MVDMAKAGMQLTEAELARHFIYPFRFSSGDFREVLEKRIRIIESKYSEVMRSHHIDLSPFTENPKALFRLIHSSFEYLLYLLSTETEDKSFFEASIRELLDRIYVQSSVYLIQPGTPRLNLFPDPDLHHKVEGYESKPYDELIDKALTIVGEWNESLKYEINEFVFDYALSWEKKGDLIAESVDDQPGHIKFFPSLFLANENMSVDRRSEIESVLMAAQMIHEGRHQKTFFFNRITNESLKFRTCGFIQDRYMHEPLPGVLNRYVYVDLLDVCLSVGYEYLFLKFILKEKDLGKYREAIEKKCERKKSYVVAGLMAGENNRDVFTDLGQLSWNSMTKLFEEGL